MRLSAAMEAEFERVSRAPIERLVGVVHPGGRPGLNQHVTLCRWRRPEQPVVRSGAYLRVLDPEYARRLGDVVRPGALVSVDARLDGGPSPNTGLWYGRFESFAGEAVDVEMEPWAAALAHPVVRQQPMLGVLRLDRARERLVAHRRSPAGVFELAIDADLDGGADLDHAAARVLAFELQSARYRAAALAVCEGSWRGALSRRWILRRWWLSSRVRLTGLFVHEGHLDACYDDAGMFDGHVISVGVGPTGEVLWAKMEG